MSKLFSKRAQILSVYTQDRLLSFCQYCLLPPRLLMSEKVRLDVDAKSFYSRILETAQRFRKPQQSKLRILAFAVEPIVLRCRDDLGETTAVGFVSFRAIDLNQEGVQWSS